MQAGQSTPLPACADSSPMLAGRARRLGISVNGFPWLGARSTGPRRLASVFAWSPPIGQGPWTPHPNKASTDQRVPGRFRPKLRAQHRSHPANLDGAPGAAECRRVASRAGRACIPHAPRDTGPLPRQRPDVGGTGKEAGDFGQRCSLVASKFRGVSDD